MQIHHIAVYWADLTKTRSIILSTIDSLLLHLYLGWTNDCEPDSHISRQSDGPDMKWMKEKRVEEVQEVVVAGTVRGVCPANVQTDAGQ